MCSRMMVQVSGALLLLAAGAAGAQPRVQALPRDVVREVVAIYNAPETMRADGRLDISIDQEVRGDVAVLNGPLTVAGHVRGRIVAINADVLLRPGSRVGNGIIIVGGVLEGRDDAAIGGDIQVHREALAYHHEGDSIVADARAGEEDDDSWWERHRRRRQARSTSRLSLVSAKTYNRVEGLPIYLGPTIRLRDGDRRLSLDLYGVIRTADNLRFESDRPGADLFGHNVRGEISWQGVGLGIRSYDLMDAVENWQLSDPEVGLASFFLHRDYRDYYNRHGAGLYLKLYRGETLDLQVGYSGERWASRSAADPWTLFRNGDDWRPNPAMENTLVHLATAALTIDTRNDEQHPTTGWYVRADYERGLRDPDSVTLGTFGSGFRGVFDAGRDDAYNRLFVDLRRYNRLSPGAQLHLRMVLGGWAGQSALPIQRRLSVPGGAGTVPGFDFRRVRPGQTDVGTCNPTTVPGTPALCDRVALFQAEYRGDLHIDLFGWNDDSDGWRFDVDTDPNWVLFLDAGRGWLVGPSAGGDLYAPAKSLPPLGSFRTDLGIGLEFDGFGAFVAKAVSDSGEPANFFIRLRHRF